MHIQPASRGLSPLGRWIFFLVMGGAALLIWQPLSRMLGQILLALLLTGAALPICRMLEKRLPRGGAAALAILALALGAAGLIGLIVPHLIAQLGLLIQQLPRLLSIIEGFLQRIFPQDTPRLSGIEAFDPAKWLGTAAKWLGDHLPAIISSIGTGVDFISRAFLSPILAYYFLRDRETFAYGLSLWIPIRHRKRFLTALQEMRREAGGYIRGQLMVSLSVAVMTAAGLLLLGVPAWLVLGLVMGICELIPYVGPLIGGVPIVVFSLSQGLSTTLWALGLTIVVQQIEGYFLSPQLVGGATGLHPVYILLLLTAGGLIGGLAGMMLALPLFVCIRGAARVFYATREPIKL